MKDIRVHKPTVQPLPRTQVLQAPGVQITAKTTPLPKSSTPVGGDRATGRLLARMSVRRSANPTARPTTNAAAQQRLVTQGRVDAGNAPKFTLQFGTMPKPLHGAGFAKKKAA